jgi:4'-phosphopantetheinyl transferase
MATALKSRPSFIPEPVPIASFRSWYIVRDLVDRYGTAVVCAPIDEWAPVEQDGHELRAMLGRDWARYRSLGHPALRRRFAATRSLLKHAAAVVLRADPTAIELAYGPSGRPYLRGCDSLDLSLSHTEELLVVGLTTRGLVGVDVERADRPLYDTGLGRQICTPYELALLDAMADADRNPGLVRLWTLKEAYSKAIGQGMRFRFTEFGFTPGADDANPAVLTPDGAPGTGSEWSLRTFLLADGFCLSAVVYDVGFGEPADTAARTMLDPGLTAALLSAMEQEP